MDSPAQPPDSRAIGQLRRFIEAGGTRRFIIAVIIANAVVIGLETSPRAMATAGLALRALDWAALAIFVAELAIKLTVYRRTFFHDPWNIFDFVIVSISLVPAGEGLSVARTLRILRALRLISLVPRMRVVVRAFLEAIPGMGAVVVLLMLVFYVAAVMSTKLFGVQFDAWFGTLGRSAFTLFQIMTLESWAMGIVRPVMELYPYAWAFFVPFILVVTFAVLNLFIAIVVNSMQNATGGAVEETLLEEKAAIAELLAEVRQLRQEVRSLRDPLFEARS